MVASIVSSVTFWSGMAAAVAIPLVSPVYRWFYPLRKGPGEPQGFWQNLGAVLDSLNSFTDGVAIFVWMAGLTVIAILASVVAFIAAVHAAESVSRKCLCGLPVVTAAAVWLLLIFMA